ncbi:MAG: hypothetical protein PHV59_04950, partial [Victivallales bacterium]|nr:hypothetical protein [Victivallales bacterium]
MDILWLCNIPLPQVAAALSLPVPPAGGWMTGMLNGLQNNGRYNLTICFPQKGLKTLWNGKISGLDYYAFPATNPNSYDSRMEIWFKEIMGTVKPDLVHIFGTEF